MEVLGINSSPRKRVNNARLLAAVLKGAEDDGCETVEITLSDYEIRFCFGCEACYRPGPVSNLMIMQIYLRLKVGMFSLR